MTGSIGTDTTLLIAASGISALVLLRPLAQSQIRISRRPRPRSIPVWLSRSIGALGASLAIASPAGATDRTGGSPYRPIPVAPVQPWSETGGDSPPAPPVRAQAPSFETDEATRFHHITTRPEDHPQDPARNTGIKFNDVDTNERPSGEKESSFRTPSAGVPRAVHPTRRVGDPIPLFPRVGVPNKTTERRACMGRHPSAGDMKLTRRYTIRPGDTLWDIAAEVLGTDEPSRIARYWPQLHRANRAAIGSNPHLLIPGTVLHLPAEGRSR